MKPIIAALSLFAGVFASFHTQVVSQPRALALPAAVVAPDDRPYRGTIRLAVTATDTDHQVFAVHETIPVQAPGATTLLYPQWETGSHAPTASIAELAGLVIHVDGRRIEWRRDRVKVHASTLTLAPARRPLPSICSFSRPRPARCCVVAWSKCNGSASCCIRRAGTRATFPCQPG